MFYIVWNLIYLVVCTFTDIRERKIYTLMSFANIFIACILHFILKDIHWMHMIAGVVLAMIFFSISVLTKEQIGMGDCVIILTMSCICGIMNVLPILIIGLCICSVFGIGLIFLKKKCLGETLPFAPFLLIGGIVILII